MAPQPPAMEECRESISHDKPTEGLLAVGPDLNASRPPLDVKLYRHITLPNGLEALLIQDTLAIQQHGRQANGLDVYSDDETQSEEDDGSAPVVENEDDEDEDAGGFLRDAACCILVGAGSVSETCPGLAHFLEHLLFMGSKKYPGENDYEAYVAKHGGSDNAWTEWEYTAYSLEIPAHALWPAVDRLAQFFVEPLLLADAVDRELKSIESEFQLNKNSDATRRQQLICSCSDPNHPMCKFSWGNLASLKEMPNKLGIDPLKELRAFYDKHYYAGNIRLAIQGAFTLDELEVNIVRYFSNVPALPRDGSPPNLQLNAMKNAGFPLPARTLGTITRIVPVRDRHELTITWQFPSQIMNWKSKPTDFLAHLMGHEASGSLLSYARQQSWATGGLAGKGEDGSECATSHSLFSITFVLSEAGLRHWKELVLAVYEYIGMLRHHSQTGWPDYIFQELQRIHELEYMYGNEMPPDETVEHLVEIMAPHSHIPKQRLLDGSSLLFEFGENQVKSLLDDYMLPEKARIDLISSSFGKPAAYDHVSVDPSSTDTVVTNLVIGQENELAAGSFNAELAGNPQIDPMFGTLFWCNKLPASWLEQWTCAAEPGLSAITALALPPRNPFVPENFELKPRPADDADHPLLHASLKLCIAVGKKRQWFPAAVIQYNSKNNSILVSYESEDVKWHTLDQCDSHFTLDLLTHKESFEGTMDGRKIKYRIVSLARPGARGVVRMFGDESDFDVQDGTAFPLIPPPSKHLPILIANSNALKLWWLQDRQFKRPIAELRLQIICANANASPLHRAVADLLRCVVVDRLTETAYLAQMCQLSSDLEATDVGFTLRINGFDDKMEDLFKAVMEILLSFRGKHEALPETVTEERLEACKEALERGYINAGMAAAGFSSTIRLKSIQPNFCSANEKLKALKGVSSVQAFCETVSSILETMSVEGLIHGNIDRNGAVKMKDLILGMLDSSGGAGLSRKKYPPLSILRIPAVETPHLVFAPSKDPEEPNTSCELYIQVGKDNLFDRTMLDLLLHVMDEPIYDQIRTKDQFGYDVHCDVRWSYGILGCIFHVTTNVKSAHEVVERIDKFLIDFRQELEDMSKEDFQEHLVGLAKQKLDMFNKMSEETDCLWSEICNGRFDWESWRNEAAALRSITKNDAVKAFDQWISPGQQRKVFAVAVIGVGETDASNGRPVVEAGRVGDYVDDQVENFHSLCKNQYWGRVNSKLF